jgi:hypothetical protein
MRPLLRGGIRNRGEFVPVQDYTPAWTATAGTAPAIGNGTLTGKVETRGKWRRVSIDLLGGGTTTWGTTAGSIWHFSVPVAATRNAVGSAFILDSGTTFYAGVANIDSGTSFVYVTRDNSAQPLNFQTPMTWTVSDRLTIDLEYLA